MLEGSSDSEQRDRNADNSGYFASTPEDMRDMAKMLEEVKKPEAHGFVFCSSLQFARWYKALLSQLTKERTSNASDHEDLGYESEYGETAEKQPVLR